MEAQHGDSLSLGGVDFAKAAMTRPEIDPIPHLRIAFN